MRCSCCDKELTDSEATAKFVERDGRKPFRFVEMCAECKGYLPPDVRTVSRPQRDRREEPMQEHNPFDLEDGGGSEWDDS